jgi:hypothetical protein
MSLLHFAWDSLNHLIGRLIHDNGGVMSGASVVASHQQRSNAPRPCGVLQAHSTHGEASIRNRFSRRSPIAMLARPHWATINGCCGFRFRHFIVRGKTEDMPCKRLLGNRSAWSPDRVVSGTVIVNVGTELRTLPDRSVRCNL